MTGFERPAPDIAKITTAWRTWEAQGDDVLPGRTMADLKIGGVDRMLEDLTEADADVAPIVEAWSAWERGKVGPNETLAALTGAGFADLIEAVAEATPADPE